MAKEPGVDAVSGATRWMVDDTCPVDPTVPYSGYDAAPPVPTGEPPARRPAGTADDVDATTGATPGMSAACRELGMATVEDVVGQLGIKPPGVS